MTASAQRLFEEAMDLSPEDRADIAAKLIGSLDSEQEAGAAEAWSAEIAQRIDDLDSGRVKAIPWPEARRRIAGSSESEPNG